jgi:small subunit ribosomal protein S16
MLKIRLRRMGAIRQPHYRIVVADARAPRDGAFIETLGHYNPLTDPATIQVDVAKYEEWKRKGAQPTDAVASLVKQFNRANRATAAAATATEAGEGAATATADRRTRSASGRRATATPVAEVPAPVAEETEAAAEETEAAPAAEETEVAPVTEEAEAEDNA